MTSVFATKITKVYNALINRINDSIATHNTSNNAHSFLFNNKANLIHNHNDIYYTETEIDNLMDSKADSSDIPDVSSFITQSSITTHNTDNNAHTDIRNSIPTKVSDLTNDSGFLTTHQSLSNYYTKSEIDDLIGNIEEDMQS